MRNFKFDNDTMLRLITNSNSSFDKIRYKLENLFFPFELVSSEVPLEFQKSELESQEEYNNRFLISTGSISTAIVQYLLYKNCGNEYNINQYESVKKTLFTNILKIRKKVILRNQLENNDLELYFYDKEEVIEDNQKNFNLYSKRINKIAEEIDFFISKGNDIQMVRNYFGVRMGQVLPEILNEKNDKIGDFIKVTIKNNVSNIQTFFFDLL